MIEEQNFDVRTITMGISLLDCIDPDIDKAAEKVYNKIVTKAKDLVAVGDEIAAELGIPIVNKRVSVTPISIIGAATNATDYVPFASFRQGTIGPPLGATDRIKHGFSVTGNIQFCLCHFYPPAIVFFLYKLSYFFTPSSSEWASNQLAPSLR
jgi:hypothetical protein